MQTLFLALGQLDLAESKFLYKIHVDLHAARYFAHIEKHLYVGSWISLACEFLPHLLGY
jgi:hypothetical protein